LPPTGFDHTPVSRLGGGRRLGGTPTLLKNMTDTLATTNPQPDLKKLQQQTKVAGSITLNSIDDLQKLKQILSQSGLFDNCKQAARRSQNFGRHGIRVPAFAAMCGVSLLSHWQDKNHAESS